MPAVTTIIVVRGVIRILDVLFTLKFKYQHMPRHQSHILFSICTMSNNLKDRMLALLDCWILI